MPGQVDTVRTVNSFKGVAKRAVFFCGDGVSRRFKVRIKCAAML